MPVTQKDENKRQGRANDARPPEFIIIEPPRKQTWITAGIALVITLFLHALLIEAVPTLDLFGKVKADGKKPEGHSMLIHMVKPEPPPEQKPPDQYVQTNPEVPENKPDDTVNFGARDQQASQIEKSEELGPDPESKGELEDSNALVTGQKSVELPPVPPAQQQSPRKGAQAAEDAQPKQPILPEPPAPPQLPDALTGDNKAEGEGAAEYERQGKEKELPDQTPPEKVVPATRNVQKALQIAEQQSQQRPDGGPTIQPQPTPRPRPRLFKLPDASPSVIRKNDTGIANATGAMAWDSNFSEFGDYLNRVFDIIGIKWNELNGQGKGVLGDLRTFVAIKFYINKDGQVEDLEVVQSTATQVAEWRCIDAIKANAPYFPWTNDMISVLGDRQPIMIRFYYR